LHPTGLVANYAQREQRPRSLSHVMRPLELNDLRKNSLQAPVHCPALLRSKRSSR